MRHEFHDVRDFFTAIAEHPCEGRAISSKDEQGTTLANTWLGFACACGDHFVLGLAAAKSIQKPMRGYITTREGRILTARRLTSDPKAILTEMRNSGGWAQPDPGVTMMTAMAAAVGPEGNPMQKRLEAMMKGGDKPD